MRVRKMCLGHDTVQGHSRSDMDQNLRFSHNSVIHTQQTMTHHRQTDWNRSL